MIQLVDDGYHNSPAVRAGDYFIFKLKFLLYGHVMYILMQLMLHEGSTLNLFY